MCSNQMVVNDKDARFATEGVGIPTDAIDLLRYVSEDFYWIIIETGNDCANAVKSISEKDYHSELNGYLGAMNFFLLGIWSATGGLLPKIGKIDINEEREKMGSSDYLYEQLFSRFSHRESFHFVSGLAERLGELKLYTMCQCMLLMRIIMENIHE